MLAQYQYLSSSKNRLKLSFTASVNADIMFNNNQKMIWASPFFMKKMSLQRYKENPFIEGMIVPVKGKKIQLSPLGKSNNVLINQHTGECYGTHVTTFKKVDSEQFVKLFTANIALTFGLNSAGIKVFNVLIWAIQFKAISKDQVDLDSIALDDFLNDHKDNTPPVKLSLATFKRGLNELEESSIIAKTLRPGRYFINPNFCFNGDRIAFTTMIEKK